jgi:uncharacterized membrane protein
MATHNQLIVCTFPGDGAEEARVALQDLAAEREIATPDNIAVLRKRDDGTVTFWETASASERRTDTSFGMIAGWLLGAVGAVLGAPLGPSYGMTTGDAAATEVAAARDVGFPDDMLRHLGERLNAGESAIVTLLPFDQARPAVEELERLGGKPVQSTLPPEMLSALE